MMHEMVHELKIIFKMLTIFIGVLLYFGTWKLLINNWDEYMGTEYNYPCLKKVLQTFYTFWIIIHALGIAGIFVWAWVF